MISQFGVSYLLCKMSRYLFGICSFKLFIIRRYRRRPPVQEVALREAGLQEVALREVVLWAEWSVLLREA